MRPFGVILAGALASSSVVGLAAPCEVAGRDNQFGPFELCASSVLPPQGANTYGPAQALDFDASTAWVEGAPGNGEGEWLQVGFGSPTTFQSIFIVNGYAKDRQAFRANGRVREAHIETADGIDLRVTLKDEMATQEVRLPRKSTSPWLRLGIASVYPGARWQDTAISELWVGFEEFNYQPKTPAGYLTEGEALDRVMAIPEVRDWSALVHRAGHGVVSRTETEAPAPCSTPDCRWCFRLLEDLPTHTATFGVYCIDGHTREQWRIDPASDEAVPLGL